MLQDDGHETLDNVSFAKESQSIDSLVGILKGRENGSSTTGLRSIYTNYGSGSGGYAENVFIMASKELFSREMNCDQLNFKTVKNSDFKEFTLENEHGAVLLRFAIANGFRNIQNLVQKMKRKKCNYDFVEIMACPSGCLNGGAQCKPNSLEKDMGSVKAFLAEMERIYMVDINNKCWPTENPDVETIYDDWLGGKNTEKAIHYLYTEYHEVEKMTNSLAIKW